jgi:GTP-binding protein
MFVDQAQIIVRSGAGGDGCISFRREKYIPRGGPDGGDGGRGGSVILVADPQLSTLVDVSRKSLYAAEAGRQGRGANCHGRSGKDLELHLPVGTLVRLLEEDGQAVEFDEDGLSPLIADLSGPGQDIVVAHGGKGGRGNRRFAGATRQTPRIAEDGGPSVVRRLALELKLLADVGLIGLPNAGKSTLLSRISAANPKIANYPFTTLHPVLGIAELSEMRRLVFADIPGLIEGAHEGHGLGIDFLRHVERTRVLVHLVSAEAAGGEDELVSNFHTIESELAGFNEELARKPRLVVLSKGDLMPPDDAENLARSLSESIGLKVRLISSVTGAGLPAFLNAVDGLIQELEHQGDSVEKDGR